MQDAAQGHVWAFAIVGPQPARGELLHLVQVVEQVLRQPLVTHQPSIDKKQVQQLATCHYIEHGDNVIVLGPPGVGKTHLAVSLGLKAIESGYRALFTTAAHLIAVLAKAHAEGRLDEKLKVYTTPRLLIIDEIGYQLLTGSRKLGVAFSLSWR